MKTFWKPFSHIFLKFLLILCTILVIFLQITFGDQIFHITLNSIQNSLFFGTYIFMEHP